MLSYMSKRGFGHLYQRGNIWWMSYSIDGQQVWESTGQRTRTDAAKVLKKKLGSDMAPGVTDRVTMAELFDDLLAEYRANRSKSLKDFIEPTVRRLREHWDRHRAVQVTTAKIRDYRDALIAEGRADATANRHMAILRRAMKLGAKATPPKVRTIPAFPMLTENNVRKGFLEAADYYKLLRHLNSEIAPLVVTAYHTGARQGELLRLKWKQVDLERGIIRLDPGTTKNSQGRLLPIFGDMATALRRQHDYTVAYWPRCQFVFHRSGHCIKDFRWAWARATEAAGLKGLLFHDLRRSGVRNLVRAGAPERVAMAISGHRTRAIFDRYNIVSEDDLHVAGERVAEYLGAGSGARTPTVFQPQEPKSCASASSANPANLDINLTKTSVKQ